MISGETTWSSPGFPLGRTTVGGAGSGNAESASGGRPDDERGQCYLRIFTALATTRIPTTTEISCSAIIMSFAQGLTAEMSAGLNASAVFTERCR